MRIDKIKIISNPWLVSLLLSLKGKIKLQLKASHSNAKNSEYTHMNTIDAIYQRRVIKHYESCFMIGFEIEKLAELINLPVDYITGSMVAIDKNTTDAWPRSGQLPLSELVFQNSF